MGDTTTVTRTELIDVFTEDEKRRRADPHKGQPCDAFWATRTVDLVARFRADAFLAALRNIRRKEREDIYAQGCLREARDAQAYRESRSLWERIKDFIHNE